MIHIYAGVGSSEDKPCRPFCVQQAALEAVSSVFKRIFGSDNFREAQEGVLRVPRDDRGAWAVFLYWLFHRQLQYNSGRTDHELLLVRCWCMGHKYDIKEFQDHVMWCLLDSYDKRYADLDAVKERFVNTPPHRQLRKLLAQEAVRLYRAKKLSCAELNELDGTAFMGEFMAMLEQYKEKPQRLKQQVPVKKILADVWSDFMVGDSATIPFACYPEASENSG